ncbi:MAG: hypothetical protein WEC75_00665 [Dehalococcoidia bacterium]
MTQARPSAVTVAVIGAGEDAGRWTRALRGVEGVRAEQPAGQPDDQLLEGLSRKDVAAVAFAGPIADAAVALKRAVMAGRHVLVATPLALASRQLLGLDDLAQRRERVMLFDSPLPGDEQVAFVRKMTQGPNALWRPRYVRALHTGAAEGQTLDELAMAETHAVLSITGGIPSRVSAVAPRVDDESGAAPAAMLTLVFEDGPVARIDVSLLEPEPRQEIIVACEGRTFAIDLLDGRTPLRILAGARHRGPQRGDSWAETVSEHPMAARRDHAAAVAQAFITAVRARDRQASNAREWASAALVWERARESMAQGGELLPVGSAEEAGGRVRPSLKVLEGGGRSEGAMSVPELTVVERSG